MITDGLIVLLLGMTVVFAFLIALTTVISLLSRVLRNHAREEEGFLMGEAQKKQERRKAAAERLKQPNSFPSTSPQTLGSHDPQTLTAVITAALNLHRRR
ncbi:MAG: OadG family protein [Opitutales bacterium]|nr:OadG family protein [Opitutales bacterium]